MMTDIELKSNPTAQCDVLRYQYGRVTMRRGMEPQYKHPTGYEIEKMVPMRRDVAVWELVGFGTTKERAARMARERLVK